MINNLTEYGTLKRTLTNHTKYISALTVLSSGDLASGSFDSAIKIWKKNDGPLKRTLTGHNGYVYALETLLNGDLASGAADRTIKIN
jgi:WD40 repeat protein